MRRLLWLPLVLACGTSCESTETLSATDASGLAAADAIAETAAIDLPELSAAECGTDCGEMVAVPEGAFEMGCHSAMPAACDPDERPSHTVAVPSFSIDRLETTVALWTRCVADGACVTPNASSKVCNWGVDGRENHPINCIEKTWAGSFCRWAGKRLCSESEWEKAALGTDGRLHPWGNEAPTCGRAVLDEGGFGCGIGTTWPVGSKPSGASPYGLQDMAGNVLEWVEDDYRDSYVGAPADGTPWEASTGTPLARGGAFSDKAPVLRGSNRAPFDLHLDGYYLGLRCCRSGTP